jgi:hypothetical protein
LKAWEELDIRNIDRYVKGMPKQVGAILAAKGGYTTF